MKEPAATSPFAALSSQEQKEKWICWQSQKQPEERPVSKPTDGDGRSESVLRLNKPTVSRESFVPHHSQYDAVVRRMQQAKRQVTAYVSCSSEGSTRQD